MTDSRPVHISLKNAQKSFTRAGKTDPVLNNISLDIFKGEFLTFFGPNGCGKSTLLNVIAGIESLDSGEAKINSGETDARVGYVFQDYRGNLMPWLTVAENIALPLKIRGVPQNEHRSRIISLMERFGFNIDLQAHTYTLSGGQAQLTSILRALIIEPDILIMDEPFSALDYQTNLSLYEKVLHVWETAHITTLLVSHDIDEALYLGERTVFLTKRPATITEVLECRLDGKHSLEQFGSEQFAAIKKQALKIFTSELGK